MKLFSEGASFFGPSLLLHFPLLVALSSNREEGGCFQGVLMHMLLGVVQLVCRGVRNTPGKRASPLVGFKLCFISLDGLKKEKPEREEGWRRDIDIVN